MPSAAPAGYNIRWLMRAILAQAAKAAKAAFLALSKLSLYGLNSAMGALKGLSDVLSLIRIAVHASSLGTPLPALPAQASAGLR
jgi:hypothetical protein